MPAYFTKSFLYYVLISSSAFGFFGSDDYVIETKANYKFKACEKFAADKSNSYYLTCNDKDGVYSKGVIPSGSFTSLEKDVKALSKSALEEIFLNDLQKSLINSFESESNKLHKLLRCIDIKEDTSKECRQLKSGLVYTLRDQLPKVRSLLALKDIPAHQFSPEQPERFKANKLRHTFSKKNVKNLNQREKTFLKAHTMDLEEKFKHKILSEIDTKIIPPECIDKKDKSNFKLKDTKRCKPSLRVLDYRISHSFEQQKKVYQEEYNTIISENPLLTYIDLRGDESEKEILSFSYSQLKHFKKNIKDAMDKLAKLKGSDRLNLLGLVGGVEKFLEKKPPQYTCDVIQNLRDQYENRKIKQDLGLGALALVGGGVCAVSAGLGCMFGVATLTSASALGLSHTRYLNARHNFLSGRGDAKDVSSESFNRNLALYLTPLSFVGGGLGRYSLRLLTFRKPGQIGLKGPEPVRVMPPRAPQDISRKVQGDLLEVVDVMEKDGIVVHVAVRKNGKDILAHVDPEVGSLDMIPKPLLAKLGIKAEGKKLYYPGDAASMNKMISKYHDELSPELKDFFTKLKYYDADGMVDNTEFLENWSRGFVPYAQSTREHFHDIGVHLNGYLLIPETVAMSSQKQVHALVRLQKEFADDPAISRLISNRMVNTVNNIERSPTYMADALRRLEPGAKNELLDTGDYMASKNVSKDIKNLANPFMTISEGEFIGQGYSEATMNRLRLFNAEVEMYRLSELQIETTADALIQQFSARNASFR